MKKTVFLIVFVLALSHICINSAGAESYRADYKTLSLTEEDLVLASKAVRAEASGENYLVKACVTAMIFNRLSGDPESGMKGAVYGCRTFLNADTSSIDKDVSEDELYEYTVLAKLVYEYGIDPTCGATLCFDASGKEAYGCEITISVGGRIFAKPKQRRIT